MEKFFDLEAEDLEDWGDDEDQDIVNMVSSYKVPCSFQLQWI